MKAEDTTQLCWTISLLLLAGLHLGLGGTLDPLPLSLELLRHFARNFRGLF